MCCARLDLGHLTTTVQKNEDSPKAILVMLALTGPDNSCILWLIGSSMLTIHVDAPPALVVTVTRSGRR